MNSATTKRRERRFRALVPLLVTFQRGAKTFVPRDISTSPCFFDFPQPLEIGSGPHDLEIGMPNGKSIQISGATVYNEESRGWGFRWELNASQTVELFLFLKESSSEPSTDSKIAYLSEEQRSIYRILHD